ncbi:MAG: hypothetical protein U5R14_03980 [Gemmatimonadota bacterium]|nr:hypothetical protein [Gemmatimonadota bacterium]
MALHDTYARRTPFEIAFPDPSRAQTLADQVFEEAQARSVDPHHPQMFATLGAVGGFVEELRDPDAPPEAAHQYAALAFHGVHFVRASRPLYLLDTEALRHLVDQDPGGDPDPPSGAGYLQLPQHLVWIEAEGAEGDAPESLDGVFWTTTPAGMLHALLVTGLRPDRPGVGVIPVPEAPLSDAPTWGTTNVRTDGEGEDFDSSIPGADLDRLYGIRAAGEPLKLLARFFAYVAVTPEAGGAEQPPEEAEPGEPLPSALPYTRISVNG